MDPRARRRGQTAELNERARAVRAALTGSSARQRKIEDELLVASQRLIERFIRRYRGPDVEDDDLLAEARIAVWQAARQWDPARMASFASWARIRLRGACQKAVRNARLVPGVHHSRIVGSDTGGGGRFL